MYTTPGRAVYTPNGVRSRNPHAGFAPAGAFSTALRNFRGPAAV